MEIAKKKTSDVPGLTKKKPGFTIPEKVGDEENPGTIAFVEEEGAEQKLSATRAKNEATTSDTTRSLESEMVGHESDFGMQPTRFGDLNGPMSISKTVSIVVGPTPDRVIVGGCNVVIPEDSFETNKRMSITAEIDSSKWPKNFVAFTPMLDVDVDANPRSPLQITLPSWAVHTGENHAKARIMHKPRESNEWKDTGIDLPLTCKPFFEFEWQDFSSIIIGATGFDAGLPEFRLCGGIYASDLGEVTIAFHLNDLMASTSQSLAAEWVSKQISELSPPKNRKAVIQPIRVITDESINTSIEAKTREKDVHFDPRGPISFLVDRDFIGYGSRMYDFVLSPLRVGTNDVHVAYNVSTSASQSEDHSFVITAKIPM